MTFLRFFTGKTNDSVTLPILEKAQEVASTVSKNVSTVTAAASHVASNAAQNVASTAQKAVSSGHGHGHGHHAAPWEGVNLWRTPYKGDADTITQVKRSKGALDKYVESRTRYIQQMQLFALVCFV